jgi:hypothetical protein
LVGFTDSNWTDDTHDLKSTTSYVFSLGYGLITWACKKQHFISLSSIETKYRATINTSQEALWI